MAHGSVLVDMTGASTVGMTLDIVCTRHGKPLRIWSASASMVLRCEHRHPSRRRVQEGSSLIHLVCTTSGHRPPQAHFPSSASTPSLVLLVTPLTQAFLPALDLLLAAKARRALRLRLVVGLLGRVLIAAQVLHLRRVGLRLLVRRRLVLAGVVAFGAGLRRRRVGVVLGVEAEGAGCGEGAGCLPLGETKGKGAEHWHRVG